MTYKQTAKDLKRVVSETRPEKERVFLSTGNTLLNLCLSDKADGGILAGRYHLWVGDSSSGKTFSSMALFAEALRNPLFQEHRLIFDDVEGGNLFDLEKFFGATLVSKLTAPKYDGEVPLYSDTAESFYYNLDETIRQGDPFIYVLDSMDALTSSSEQDKFEEQRNAYVAGKQAPGSYGDGKAKVNSACLRKVIQSLADTNSILVIINQTRDDLRFGVRGKSRSGGYALEFYATSIIWATVKGSITKTVKGKSRTVGQEIQIAVKKNRTTGTLGKHVIPFYVNYGFDDLHACVSYLVDEGYWRKDGLRVDATEFSVKTTVEKLVRHIESENKEAELQRLAATVWQEVKNSANTDRKAKYM